MAIPTITAVAPGSGPTTGQNIVKIDGSNFRLPDTPPAEGPLGGPAQRTIKITIGGIVSDWAHAVDAGIIYARVPEWRGDYKLTFPVALDVRIANLDNTGAEIPGENATLLNGYAVTRPSLAAESYLQRVIGELVTMMRRHLLVDVYLTASRDYNANPSNPDIARLFAKLPCVHLGGPHTTLNRFYSVNREDYEEDPADPNMWLRKKEPVTVDLEFRVVGWAANMRQLSSLGQAVVIMFRDVKWIEILKDPAQPLLGTVRYELEMPFTGQPDYNTAPSTDDLRNFRAVVQIRGVHIDPEAGTIVERGWDLFAGDGEPVLDTQDIEPV